ncbi:Mycolic acid cyclopropane synthetase-domain-containing protein [Panaeolus papilionaceus]|nr:Mycolic acid cyclopropane synthetase-domain-containing protein [Panaeolus papilionaceus]
MALNTSKYIETININYAKRSLTLSALESVLNSGQEVISKTPWRPLLNFAKKTILDLLKRVERGVIVFESEGESYKFGHPYDVTVDGYSWPLSGKITVKQENFWVRMLLHADFGFADAYMLGEIEVDKLSDVFKIFLLNRKNVGELSTLLTPVVKTISYIANLRLANGLAGSMSNISAHYDLSNDFFAAFLSWDMTYTAAIFDEKSKGPVGDLIEPRPMAPPRREYDDIRTMPMDDLERGQMAKLHLIARRARIKSGSRVLEIGAGWGSFAILIAQKYGAIVDTTTISQEQKIALDKNIAAAGLSHAINVHVMDYRQMPAHFHQAFDSVVSIGVMEHIGIEFMKGWFDKMAWAMKPENSFKVFVVSTVPDTRWRQYSSEVDFIRKYIYPGGQLTSVRTLVNDIVAAGLNIESIENIGPHYARTVREWGYRFDRNFESHVKPALLKDHPQLTDEDLYIFQRKWKYYFAYCDAGFTLRNISDNIFTLTREANVEVTSTCADPGALHFLQRDGILSTNPV